LTSSFQQLFRPSLEHQTEEYCIRIPRQLSLEWNEFRLNRAPFAFDWMTYRVSSEQEVFRCANSEPDDDSATAFEEFLEALPSATCCNAIYNLVHINSEGVELESASSYSCPGRRRLPSRPTRRSSTQRRSDLLLHGALQGVTV
jgi:hypothetical protein